MDMPSSPAGKSSAPAVDAGGHDLEALIAMIADPTHDFNKMGGKDVKAALDALGLPSSGSVNDCRQALALAGTTLAANNRDPATLQERFASRNVTRHHGHTENTAKPATGEPTTARPAKIGKIAPRGQGTTAPPTGPTTTEPAAEQAPTAPAEIIPATPPPAADEDTNPTAGAAAPRAEQAATATPQTVAAATPEGASPAGPTAAAAPPAKADENASLTKLPLGEGMDAYAAVARTLAAVHGSTTGIDEKPNVSAVSTLCGDKSGWSAVAFFVSDKKADEATKVMQHIIAAQHAHAAQHREHAPTDATAILMDAMSAHHTTDCALNPKVTSTQLCAACVELGVETHRPATVAFDRKTWSPLHTATGADVSAGERCTRCGQQMISTTTVTPTIIAGVDYGIIIFEGQGLPSELTWGPHKATLLAGLAKTKEKVWATVIRNGATGTEHIATAKKIANRKEEAIVLGIYKVRTTKWSNPTDTEPAHTAATPPTANDRNTAPRTEQQPINAPPRRNRGDKNTATSKTRRFRRVHVTGPGIARSRAGDLLIDLSAIEVTHYGRFAIATMPTADAAVTLVERGSSNRYSKALRATIDKPWLRKLWQPRDQASLRDTPPPPPTGRPPHVAAQRPKVQPQQVPQPQQAPQQQQQQPAQQAHQHQQQQPAQQVPQPPQTTQAQQPPQAQQEQPPRQQAETQQQQQQQQPSALEQAQQLGREQAQRDAETHAQQLARQQAQQRADLLNDVRTALRDLLMAELPNAVAAFVGPQQNLQQPSFYYPNMGFPGPRTGMGFPAAPMGMGHQAWPPAPISSQ